MSDPDKLQRLWQSQPTGAPPTGPDQLLKAARLERRAEFLSDVVVIAILSGVGAGMLVWALHDIHRLWPWLIYSASDVWVIWFMLSGRWRRRREAARYDDSLLAHVEWSIKGIEHRMARDRRTFWWYVLPLALGCMIPPVILFGTLRGVPVWQRLVVLLFTLGFFAAVFAFVHVSMKWGQRKEHVRLGRELESLRALRDTLLNMEK